MPLLRNLIANPSVELNASGWVGLDATVARELGAGVLGLAGLRVATSAGAPLRGVYWSPSPIPDLPPGPVSAGILVRAPAGAQLSLTITSTGAAAQERSQPFTGTGGWQWVTVTTPAVGADRNPHLLVRTTVAAAVTFHLDTAMIVPAEAMVNYADGDTAGWVWDGARHASTSRGPASSYAPEAQLLRSGTTVDYLDLVPGFDESAELSSFVQVPVGDPTLAPAVTIRPTRQLRGRLQAHLTATTGYGAPGARADAILASLRTGAPHTLRMLHDEPGLGTDLLLVPASGSAGRAKLARSSVWTVTTDFERTAP